MSLPSESPLPVPLPLQLPRAPVLDWSSFRREIPDASCIETPSVEDLPHRIYTTSGRAAIYQALRLLALPQGSRILVPTYHCPTMVAPIVRAGFKPTYFPLRHDGMPDLAAIERRGGEAVRAMIVAHYFGLPRSLAEVRSWCDRHGVVLIEDCAHSFFGQAGERQVGAWGDFATASLSKFLPVPEAGLLASSTRSLEGLRLPAQDLTAQVKGYVDVFEFAARHHRFSGIRPVLDAVFALKNARQKRRVAGPENDPQAPLGSVDEAMQGCDMGRVDRAPLDISMRLGARLPRGRILARRRANFASYQRLFADVPGMRPLFADTPAAAVPYVFPLWVDDADRVYEAIRAAGLPVYRWDRVWPGMPRWSDDTGPRWNRHVLQLLCHQDLSPSDTVATGDFIRRLARATVNATPAVSNAFTA